jgi:hypothetical protein
VRRYIREAKRASGTAGVGDGGTPDGGKPFPAPEKKEFPMTNHQQEAEAFGGRTVPPATPPTINENASALDAATRPGREGDSDFPGRNPEEIEPQQPDFDQPDRSPDQEVPDKGGDVDQPGRTPEETPPQPDQAG